MRLTLRRCVATTIAALAVLGSADCVSAQKTRAIEGGRTTVTFGSDFISELGVLDVTPRTVSPTRWHNGMVSFPAIGGAIDLDTTASQMLHSGGLTLSAAGGQTQVTLQSFIIDTTSVPVITGLVSVQGKLLGRLPLFDLVLPDGITLPLKPDESRIVLRGIGVSLDSAAASVLNSVFHVSVFKGGFNIGTAKVIVDLPGFDED